MLYKVQKYVDFNYGDSQLTEDMRKKIEVIRKNSQNFKILNESALKLDETLSQIIEFHITGNLPETNITQEGLNKIGAVLKDLVLNINEAVSNVDAKQVNDLIIQNLERHKFGLDNLESDVREKIESVQQIHFNIPDVVTPNVTNQNIPDFRRIIDQLVLGQNVFLVGGAGTGKTTLAEKIAEAIGLTIFTINCSQWTSPIQIIGGQTIEGYKEGTMIEAWKNGGLLLLDEMPKLDANTAGLLNDCLAKSSNTKGFITNGNGERFYKHKNFACIATGNIYPNDESSVYGGNNKQDLSLLDRFTGGIYWIEKNADLEKAIIGTDFLPIWTLADAIRTCIEQRKYEAQMSLRFMIGARDVFKLQIERAKKGEEWENGITIEWFIQSYLSTFSPEQREVIENEVNFEYRLSEIQETFYKLKNK